MLRMSVEDRFWSKVDKTETCWNWTDVPQSMGYGTFSINANYKSKSYLAHRYIFTILGVEIPAGKFVDHMCHNTMCVNPEHLRFVTNKENHEHLIAPYASTSSGVRGVSWNSARKKWRAQAYHNGKCHFGGLFNTIEEAGAVALKLRLELFTHNDLDRAA